ncbi:MAG: serine/threonine-protein kinase [Thermoguttaceae bacterium]
MSKANLAYLGPYRLLNVVHTGHATRIWQAYDDGRACFVAVKTPLEGLRTSREHIGYLKREYEVGSKLIHPRIIQVLEFGKDGGIPYLAMEWFAGGNLRNRLRQGMDLLLPWIPQIVLQAAEAVAYFNGRGWVHRDIKPDNFLVADSGDVKLIDFALATRKRGVLTRWLGPRRRVQGSHSYIAPEQLRGMPLDDRADLYSLACTLFELVAGRPPYTGASTQELLNKHLKAPPPALENLNPNVAPEFAQLIRWAMQKDPGARPRCAEEFYQKLRETPVFRRGWPGPRPADSPGA